MPWNRKELDSLKREVETILGEFGYPHGEPEDRQEENVPWRLFLTLANVPIQIVPNGEGRLLDVGLAAELPPVLHSRTTPLSEEERSALIERLKTVCLNKGVEYQFETAQNGAVETVVFQEHIHVDAVSAQCLLDTAEEVKDAFYMLLLLSEIGQRRSDSGEGPKLQQGRSATETANVEVHPSFENVNHIQILDSEVWALWSKVCRENEQQDETLARLMEEAGYT